MASAAGIRAGRAYIEVTLRDRIEQGARRVERRMQAMAGSIRAVARQMLIIGGLAAAAMAPALTTYAQFEDRLSAISAKTGATADELAKVRDVAKQLGATTSFSAIQVAGAGEFLAQAGRTIDQIPKDLPVMLNIARAGGDEVTLPVAADIVTNVAGGFQIPDELTRVGDSMAAIAASANVSILQLGETFKLAAPPAAAAGQAIEEMATAADILGNSGIQATNAGTDLKNLLVVMARNADIAGVSTQNADGSLRDLLDVMRDLGTATAGLSEAERLSLFIEKFGKISAKSALILSSAGSEIDRYRQIMGQADGAAARMANTMDDNLGGSFRALLSAAEAVRIALGQAIGKPVRELVDRLTAATGSVAAFINAHPELIQQAAAAAVAIGGTGAALMSLSLIATAAAFAFRPIGKAGSLVMSLRLPLGAARRGVFGLIGSLTGLRTVFGAIKVPTAFVAMSRLLRGIPAGLLAVRTAMVAISKLTLGSLIKSGGLSALAALTSPLGLLAITAGVLGTAFVLAAGGPDQMVSSLGILKDSTSAVLGGLVSSGRQAWNAVSDIGVSAWSRIVSRVQAGDLQGAASVGMAGLEAMWASTTAAFMPQWTAVTIAIEDTWNATTSVLSDLWSGFGRMFPSVADSLQTLWHSFVSFVTGNTGADGVLLSWSDVTFGVSKLIINMVAGIRTAWATLTYIAQEVVESIKGIFKGGFGELASLVITNFAQPLKLAAMIPGAKKLGLDPAEIDKVLKQIDASLVGQDRSDQKEQEAAARKAAYEKEKQRIETERVQTIDTLDEDRERKNTANQTRVDEAKKKADAEAKKAKTKLEIALVTSDIATTVDEIDRLQEKLKALADQPQTVQVRADTAALEEQLTAAKTSLATLRGTHDALTESDRQTVEIEITDTQQQLADLQARKDALASSPAPAVSAAHAVISQEITEQTAHVVALEMKGAGTAEIDEARQQLADLQAQSDALASSRGAAVSAAHAEISQEITEQTERVERLELLGADPAEIDAARQQLADLQAKRDELHGQSVAPEDRGEYLAINQQIDDLQAKLDSLQNTHTSITVTATTKEEREQADEQTLTQRIDANRDELSDLARARQRIFAAASTGRKKDRQPVTDDSVDAQTGLTLGEIRQRSAAAAKRLEQAELQREAVRPKDTSPVDKETGKTVRELQDELEAAQAADPYAGFRGPNFDQQKLGIAEQFQPRRQRVQELISANAGSVGTFSGRAASQLGSSSAIDKVADELRKQGEFAKDTAKNTGELVDKFDDLGVEGDES